MVSIEENRREKTIKKTTDQARAALIKRIETDGYSVRDAAVLSDITYWNALKIYKKYVQTGNFLKEKTGSPSNRKIDSGIREFIENKIERCPTIVLKEIKRDIYNEKQISISLESIRKCINGLGITRKAVTITGVQINSERSKNLRKEYSSSFLSRFHDDRFNVFIDESGFNLHLRRRQGRSPRGQIVQVLVPAARGTNVSLISAISGNMVIHSKCVSGGVNSDIFIEFMREMLLKCRQIDNINNFNFFADNARIHHSHIVAAFLQEEHISLNFLSPYSYMLNPIEYGFSKIKAIVRRELSSGYSGEFIELILSAVNELTLDDLEGYFRHMRNNCVKAIELNDFL